MDETTWPVVTVLLVQRETQCSSNFCVNACTSAQCMKLNRIQHEQWGYCCCVYCVTELTRGRNKAAFVKVDQYCIPVLYCTA